MSAKKKTAKVRITWVKSTINRKSNQGKVIEALGLRKLHQSVVHDDSPIIRGMINKVIHLVVVEGVE